MFVGDRLRLSDFHDAPVIKALAMNPYEPGAQRVWETQLRQVARINKPFFEATVPRNDLTY